MFAKNLLIFSIILMGFILNVISVQIVGSSFSNLQGILGVNSDKISYIMSSSLIAEVIIIPFSGWLARLLSVRVLFLCSVTGFLFASLGCALSSNFVSMVIFRTLQGLSGGALIPLMMASIYTLFTPKQVPLILSIAATLGVSSIAFGPLLGGFMTEMLSWHWMFLYNIPIGLIILLAGYIYIDLDKKEKHLRSRIDYIGILLLSSALLTLLITLEEGERYDWFESTVIIFLLTISCISFLFFIIRELTTKNPIINLFVFKDNNFSIGCLNVIVFAITLYIPIFLLPIFLGEFRYLSPIQIGSIISVMGFAWMFSGPFIGYFIKTIGARSIIFFGCLFIGIGTYLQTKLTADFGFKELFIPQVLRGIGAQLLWIGNQYISMINIPKKDILNASSMFNLVLRLAAAISISTASSFLYKWQLVFYGHISQTLISSKLSLLNIKSFEFFNQSALTKSSNIDKSFILDIYVNREAFIMSLNNITYYTMWTVLIPIFLLPFTKNNNRQT